MLHGAWHTVRVGGNKAAFLKSSWIDSGSRELGLSNVSQALGSGSACMASDRAELNLYICSVCLRDQCKSEIVWLLKSELTHSLLTASNYGVFIIIIIVTLQHAQLGVEEVI